MPISTSDGQVYKDEFDLTLGRPISTPKSSSEPENLSSGPDKTQDITDEGIQKGESAIGDYLGHAVKSLVTLPQRAFQASEDLRTTGEYDPGPALETAMTMYGANAPFVRPGTLGLFGGKILPETKSLAEKMEATKFSPGTIKEMTGLERSGDGLWRKEFSDHESVHTPENFTSIEDPEKIPLLQGAGAVDFAKLPQVLKHDKLFEIYPEAKNLNVVRVDQIPNYPKAEGVFNPQTEPPTIMLTRDLDSDKARSILLHETQHYIQHIENFPKESRPDLYPSEFMDQVNGYVIRKYGQNALRNVVEYAEEGIIEGDKAALVKAKELAQHLLDFGKYKTYRSMTHEAEAFNVEARKDMTPQERIKSLGADTEDIPRREQFHIFDPRTQKIK